MLIKPILSDKWWESGDDITLITRPRRFWQNIEYEHAELFLSRQYAEKGTHL